MSTTQATSDRTAVDDRREHVSQANNVSQANDEQSSSKIVLGSLTLLSCVLVVAADFIGWAIVEKHNPISETISKLAIGNYAWVMDWGLNLFAAGIIAVAVGMFRWNFGNKKWKLASGLLVLTATSILVISEYDQYRGFDGFGADVHYGACYALFGFVFVSAVCLGFDLQAIGRCYSRLTFAFAALWLIGCPLFMFAAPDSIDGAVERGLAIALVSWIAMLGWLLTQTPSRRADSSK